MNPRQLTLTSIVFVIFTCTTSAQTGDTRDNNYEFFINNEEIKKVVDDIAKLINENKVTVSRLGTDSLYHTWGSEKNIQVLNDRIQMSKNSENIGVYFKDMAKSVSYSSAGKDVIGVYIGEFMFNLKGKGNNEKLRDDLLFMQRHHRKLVNEHQVEVQKSQLILFEPIASGYRALKVKPPVSEEQRKYIVQANSFNQKKEYSKAIELYQKAIEVDQTAYPSAYSNMALLSAQMRKFSDAIFYMKKYLLLEPEAPDSRGARDKIYEWEAELAND